MQMQLENPFDMQKASHYTDAEVLNLWVDLTEQKGGLVSILEPQSLMPIFVLGGKGSGKTHLMRYCSSPVQAARHGSLKEAIRNEGYLGIYILADALNTHKFRGKGIPEEAWDDIFAMYFETWMALSLLSAIEVALGDAFALEIPAGEIEKLKALFSADVNFRTLADVQGHLSKQKRLVEHSVNNASISRSLAGVQIDFKSGSLAFDLPDLISNLHKELQDPTYLFLIDELENFTESQQKFVNTLIRYKRGRTSLCIGARLYGIKTFETFGSGEPIRSGSEYREVRLDEILRSSADAYEKFAADLVIQRLKSAKLVPIEFSSSELYKSFQDVDRDDNWSGELLQLMKRYDGDGKLRPHQAKLSKKLQEYGLSTDVTQSIVAELSVPDHPFLEKVNVFQMLRQWKGEASGALPLAKSIRASCEGYRSSKDDETGRYASVVSHFGSDLIAQMYRDSKRRLPYAGFRTFVELSMGIPRNLIGMLGQIYKHARFLGEKPFLDGRVSVQSQTLGVVDAARAFWIEAQPDSDAPQVKESIEALALVLRSIRFSDAPSECDPCTIALKFETLSAVARANIRTAANWSHLIRIAEGHRNKNYDAIDHKYQLAPMLAPIWELSHHRRGVVEFSGELANAVFDNTNRQHLVQLVEERTKNMNAPRRWARTEQQESLF